MNKPDERPIPLPAGWTEALECGEADLAAGRAMPLNMVVADLLEANAKMDRRLAEKGSDAA